jgi:UPF0176 protein
MTFKIAAFYRFFSVASPEALVLVVKTMLLERAILGTVLIAPEGINGTIAGEPDALHAALTELERLTGSGTLEPKFSFAEKTAFKRLRVSVKREIVTMGVPEADPTKHVGKYVEPEDWNALISDPDVLVIDTRNGYEVRIGTFKGAVDPKTSSFRELPKFVRENIHDRKRKVALFCTGGIRCEKATSLMVAEGFEQVFHLKGGILKYLERVPESESLWNGGCYVFDKRVAVGHGLTPTDHTMCHACGSPLAEVDRAHPDFVQNKHCAYCDDPVRLRFEAQKI